ncbi:hypothetical protein B0J12DRAFT_229349 [Macrophomina phaseolina]|uniref:Uncharacterized protein n=1 Tax=Macrophomina phaseolina TaxID=35725 RepID=A0ABQ8GPV9_9PEZI|nr:hypothetical protein B0J12DRAFT_229349 [Macrophomina phaseolina]
MTFAHKRLSFLLSVLLSRAMPLLALPLYRANMSIGQATDRIAGFVSNSVLIGLVGWALMWALPFGITPWAAAAAEVGYHQHSGWV